MFVTLGIMMLKWKGLMLTQSQKFRYVALALYGLLTSAQEAEQFGKPFVWWRLPVLLVATACGLYGVFSDWFAVGWKARHPTNFKPLDWDGKLPPS